MTVTRMATPRGPIPVTVDTFEALAGGMGCAYLAGGGNAERRRIYVHIYIYILGLPSYKTERDPTTSSEPSLSNLWLRNLHTTVPALGLALSILRKASQTKLPACLPGFDAWQSRLAGMVSKTLLLFW